jgi:hypothetical protein
VYVPEASARTADNHQSRARSSPCSRLKRQQLRVARERLEGRQFVSYCHALTVAITARSVSLTSFARLGIRFSAGWSLIIPMIIQTILLYPSGAVWTDEASNVSRLALQPEIVISLVKA